MTAASGTTTLVAAAGAASAVSTDKYLTASVGIRNLADLRANMTNRCVYCNKPYVVYMLFHFCCVICCCCCWFCVVKTNETENLLKIRLVRQKYRVLPLKIYVLPPFT
jgi:hypothetical protein